MATTPSLTSADVLLHEGVFPYVAAQGLALERVLAGEGEERWGTERDDAVVRGMSCDALLERVRIFGLAGVQSPEALGSLHSALDEIMEFFGLDSAWPSVEGAGGEAEELAECFAVDVSHDDRGGSPAGDGRRVERDGWGCR
jgi:hypothetical protein